MPHSLDDILLERRRRRGGGGPALYLGQVATRTFVPNSFFATNKQFMWQTTHFARDDIVGLQAVLPNFYVDSSGIEHGPGASATVTLAHKDAGGNRTQGLFSGSSTGTILDNNLLVSDVIGVNVSRFSMFSMLGWYSCSAGIIYAGYSSAQPAMTGDGAEFGVTTTDKTMSGTVTQATNLIGPGPLAIIAYTRRGSAFLLDDSRVMGIRDTADSSGDLGELARSIGPSLAYINCGVSGDKLTAFLNPANSANRRKLLPYCSGYACQSGINDLNGGRTAAQLLADYQSLAAILPGKRYAATLPPITTGAWTASDGSDQTKSAWDAQRVSFNNSVRAGLPNFDGYFEIADQVESSRDSGKWKANGTAAKYTADGIHETQFANLAIASSGAINPAVFAR